jgi:hypothetical protein
MENKHKIIGITGKKYSGKDTLGSYFVEKHNYVQIAYADALKDAVKCIFDFDDEQLYGSKKEEIDEFWKITPRQVLQFVGTDLFRNNMKNLIPHIDNNIWIYVVKRKILNIMKKNPDVCFVITDARFQNEINMVKELGGIVIKVTRDNINNNDSHESESLIQKTIYIIMFIGS